GVDVEALARQKELQEKFPDAQAKVRGQDVNLSKTLAPELSSPPISEQLSSENWPIAFGDPARSRTPQISAYGGARLFSVDVDKPTYKMVPASQRPELTSRLNSAIGEGQLTGIYPVVDRGEMFFQDNSHIYAVNLESGAPLPGWLQTYDGDRNGRFT